MRVKSDKIMQTISLEKSVADFSVCRHSLSIVRAFAKFTQYTRTLTVKTRATIVSQNEGTMETTAL